MKKTVFLIILGVVTAGCICWGTLRNVYGYAEEKNTDNNKTINQTLESFSAINIDAGVMAIVIEEGSEFKIEGHANRKYLMPEISVNRGNLEIKQNKKKPRFSTGYENSRVIITIPGGTELRSIDVDTSVGDLKLNDIVAEDLDLEVDVGKITINNVAFSTLRVENNIGDVRLTPEGDFNSVEINNNVGEISVYPKENIKDYKVSLSTDVGDIDVEGQHYKNSYNSSGSSNKKITVNTNVGAINIH